MGAIRAAIGKRKPGEMTLSLFVVAERRRLARAAAKAAAASTGTSETATPPATLQDSDDDDVTDEFGLPIVGAAPGFTPAGGAGQDKL